MEKAKKESVYRYLDENKIEYKRIDTKKLDNMQACKDVENELGALVFKNLFLQTRNKDNTFLLLISPDKKFKTAIISKEIGVSRLSFGDDSDLYEYLGVRPGSITPVGLYFDKQNKVQVLIDEDLLKEEYLGMHPLENDSIFKISKEDMLKYFIKNTGHDIKVVHP